MPTGEENFKGKRNTNGFDKNPQNINRRGANRKSYAKINDTLKKKGIKPVTKSELIEFYTLIFNATEEELKKIATDQNQPLVLRTMILELNDKKLRSQAIRDFRDYMFGKADETVNHTVKARVLTKEEMKEFLNGLEENY